MEKEKEPKKIDSTREMLFGISFVFNFGFTILVPTLLGMWLGITLDNKFSLKPWLTVILLSVGSILGFFAGIYQIKRYMEKGKKLG